MCDGCGEHSHEHKHEHEHAHDHGHEHGHAHAGARPATRIQVDRAVGGLLNANLRVAARIRAELAQRGILMLNLTSAPGSGKTALLHATLRRLPEGSAAVLVGDLETDRDAARLHGMGAQVRQINTGKGCHLSAAQVAGALDQLELDGLRTVFVENVGNMACPSDYDLGEHLRVALLSLPEGDDKVAKYPGLFAAADVVLLTKVDLAHVLPFDEGLLRQDLAQLNTRAPLLKVAALGGQGMDAWMQWLDSVRERALAGQLSMTQGKV
jgi:hydrogenase nickel incorporation protein HypB